MRLQFTDTDRRTICAEYAAGGVSQRDLAKKWGCSQPTIKGIVDKGPPPPPPGGSPALPGLGQAPAGATALPTTPIDRLALSAVEDLELRIQEFDAIADRAMQEPAPAPTPAVMAKREAAKLRVQLDEARRIEAATRPRERSEMSNDDLVHALAELIPHLPDEAFEAIEDAVNERRRRAAEEEDG